MTSSTHEQGTAKSSWFANTWMFGSLASATRKTYASALYEMVYLLVWSTLPFWFGGLIGYATSDAQSKGFWATTLATFRNGELLVFTISTLAPSLYLMLHDPEGAKAFPHKLPISTTGMLTIAVCSGLFALLKSNTIRDANFVFSVSVVLSAVALALRYLSMVYHRLRLPDVSEISLRASENSFVDDFQRQVGDNP